MDTLYEGYCQNMTPKMIAYTKIYSQSGCAVVDLVAARFYNCLEHVTDVASR